MRVTLFSIILSITGAFAQGDSNLFIKKEILLEKPCFSEIQKYHDIFHGPQDENSPFVASGILACSDQNQNPQSLFAEFIYEGSLGDLDRIKQALESLPESLSLEWVQSYFFSSYVYALDKNLRPLEGFEIPRLASKYSDIHTYKNKHKEFIQNAAVLELRNWIFTHLRVKDQLRWKDMVLPQAHSIQVQIYIYPVTKSEKVFRSDRVFQYERKCQDKGC